MVQETDASVTRLGTPINKYCVIVNKGDIKKLLGITIFMGIVRLPNLKLYWDTSYFSKKFKMGNDFIKSQMSYLRYSFIRCHFRKTKFFGV